MSDTPPVFDRADLLRRVGGDVPLMTELIRMMLEDCPSQVAAIKAAVDAGKADDIRRSAHLLKGVAATVSAPRLRAAAEVMEWIGIDARLDASAEAWTRLAEEAESLMDLLRLKFPRQP